MGGLVGDARVQIERSRRDRGGAVALKRLKTDALLGRAARDEPIHVDGPGLAVAPDAGHGLLVVRRVPVRI
mgnify:CR=1 FL=1